MSSHATESFVLCLVLISSSRGVAGTPPEPSGEPGPQLTVWVYNHARVPKATLARATRTAARILRRAGVETAWRAGPLSQAEVENDPSMRGRLGATALALRVLPQSMTSRVAVPSDCFGFAQMNGSVRSPTVASVFFHRVRQLAGDRIADAAVILGHMMAHEIGHLLLLTKGHARAGIMSAPWRREHLKLVAHEHLFFSRKQAARMRANVTERMRTSRMR